MDYRKIGLRVGIEIHQRLDTKKLFCDCSSQQKDEELGKIKRKLRPSAGELGKIDPAALHEFVKNRNFIYKTYPNETCLVETDEEPPHNMNSKALNTGLQICKLLNAYVPDEIHVMRKTVIDGSNTGGFQRTAIIGIDGRLKTTFGSVRIHSVCIEEEAARIESRLNGTVAYKLNGLGIPLLEITTDTVSSPQEAKEVAESLGMMLRSVKVQRGIGSIRQDINISIAGGSRIEIKGFQELNDIPKVVENEVQRQLSLLEIKEILKKRGAKMDLHASDETPLFKNTKCNFIRKIMEKKGNIIAMKVPKFSGLFHKKCGDRSFAKELISYTEPYGVRGFIDTDEDLKKYNLVQEFEELKKKFNAGSEDAVLVMANANEKAVFSLTNRIKKCLDGVPEETRVADDIGSKYARPLPGSERMYPETDVKVIGITEKSLKAVKKPRTLEEKKKDLVKIMSKEMAEQIIRSRFYDIFEEFYKKYKIDPVFTANLFLSVIKDIKRKGFDVDKITRDDLDLIFSLLKKKKISKQSVPKILENISLGENVEKIIDRYKTLSDKELERTVKNIVDGNKDMKESALMGLVMSRVRGRADGAAVVKILRKMKK